MHDAPSTKTAQSTPDTDDARALRIMQSAFDHARRGQTDALAKLLELGVSAEVRNRAGDSLLMLASYHGHLDTTRLLLERGADATLANDRGLAPLAGAAFRGDLAMLTLLSANRANIDRPAPDGKTPLMYAAMFDRIEAIDYLLASGADVHARESSGLSALDLARAMNAGRATERLHRAQNAAVSGRAPGSR